MRCATHCEDSPNSAGRPDSPAECDVLAPYTAKSWFSAEGARLKFLEIQRKGLPDFTNWRFITLTLDQENLGPKAAHFLGNARIRKFLERLRQALGRPFRWCWKLEFQENSFSHWHLLVDYRKPIPQEMLPDLSSWWGLGRVNVRRVEGSSMTYLFKYVCKGMDDLPEWVKHHKGRIRAFQTGGGFFTKAKPRQVVKAEPKTCDVPVSLVVRQAWNARKAILVEPQRDGTRRVSALRLGFAFAAAYMVTVHQAISQGVPLVAPGLIKLDHYQKLELKNEHKQSSGLAAIPPESRYCYTYATA